MKKCMLCIAANAFQILYKNILLFLANKAINVKIFLHMVAKKAYILINLKLEN